MKRLTVQEYIKRSKEAEKLRETEPDLSTARQIEEEHHNNNMNFIYWVIFFLVLSAMF